MRTLAAPALLPFAPFIYSVWDDGELTEHELTVIASHIRTLPASAQKEAQGWLDPNTAPTAQELSALLQAIQNVLAAQATPPRSLTEIGLTMASPAHDALDLAAQLNQLETELDRNGQDACFAFLAPSESARSRADAELLGMSRLAALLDGPERDIHQQVRRFLSQHPPVLTCDRALAAQRRHTLEALAAFAAEGFGQLAYPGVTTKNALRPFLAACETLAFGELGVWVKVGVQFGLFGGTVLSLGSERHHQLLPAIAKAELLGCFAMTERDHGSNVMGIETTARYDPDSDAIEIHTPHEGARKEYIGNAACHAQLAVVFAQLSVGTDPHGVHAFLVRLRDENGNILDGVHIEDCGAKLGLDGVDNGRIRFDHVRIPRTDLLDRFGGITAEGHYKSPITSPTKRFFQMIGTLVKGRVSVASAALSATKVGLTIAIDYGGRRRQFGPSGQNEQAILDYPAHQKKLIPALARSYAIHFALRALQDELSRGDDTDTRQLEARAAGLKAYATRHATETLQACRESCGGAGYLADSRLPSLRADTDIFTTFEGDNTVLWQLVAKSLLTDFRQQFSESRFSAMARFVAKQAIVSVTEKNFARVRRCDEEHLRDPEFVSDALRYRQQRLIVSLASRLRARIEAGADPFVAFAAVQSHAIAAARAYIESECYQGFAATVAKEANPVADVLTPVRDLYGLQLLHHDARWFLEAEYFEPAKAKAIRKLAVRVTEDVRRLAPTLVAAFGVPTECLGSLRHYRIAKVP